MNFNFSMKIPSHTHFPFFPLEKFLSENKSLVSQKPLQPTKQMIPQCNIKFKTFTS